MRKLITLLILGFVVQNSFSQTQVPVNSSGPIYYKDGKVGIGTSVPGARLTTIQSETIGGKNLANAGLLVGTTSYGIGIDDNEIVKKGDGGLNLKSTDSPIYFLTGNEKNYFRMSILQNGNVGIGTTTPLAKLHISSLTSGDAVVKIEADTDNNNESDNPMLQFRQDGGTLGINMGFDEALFGSNVFGIGRLYSSNKYDDCLFIDTRNGNVSINKKPSSDAKLDVNGTIRATEIKVEAQTADFVFADNYQLKNLVDVEAYIKEHKHLPEIPGAADMEASGINLAEMNKLLLQKVEELTLYAIDKDKEVQQIKAARSTEQEERENLKKEFEAQKQLVKKQEERLAKLEELLLGNSTND